jgi:hypothetical protein
MSGSEQSVCKGRRGGEDEERSLRGLWPLSSENDTDLLFALLLKRLHLPALV